MAGTKQLLAIQYVEAGMTFAEAAVRVGLTRSAVAGACRRAGLKVGRRPSAIEAQQAGQKRMWADPERSAEARKRMSRAARIRYSKRLPDVGGTHA